MLQIRDLNVTRAGKTICQVPLLEMTRGDRVAVIGINGCGKTTLLRVISGLECEYRGKCAVGVPQYQRVYLHQTPYLFRGSVLFNVAYGLAARKMGRVESHRKAREWLEILGIDHLVHRRCGYLSGGERRRVALARVFAIQPEVLLLDEPFADLDQAGIERVCHALTLLSDSTIIVSSPTALPDQLSMETCEM
jgi:ABC-type nitrate/sulfonate/bicarbonate transport system ATPase subunit